ncbi:CAP domain-containing protein [Aquisalibacillus elongatus]|uniref:Putative YkwD family protein n=1 Tax=Aquisalibacillus elongatus TaxID=485577 RepID=A0A3N5B0C8_9BACI|nr:CAP domain-containing protein [Aquisalibacillus elongatus]RPF50619.1 putative YkwD family protein [Aquisalibacillus elongatus]
MFKLIKYAIIILVFGFIINSLPESMFSDATDETAVEDTSEVQKVTDRVEHIVTNVDWVDVTEQAVDGLNRAAMMISTYLGDDKNQEVVPVFQDSDVDGTERDDDQVHEFERQVHELVNEEREKHGLEPVEFSVDVSHVARAKSQDMADEDYFSHESPTYGSPFEMMDEFGLRYVAAGENIAMGQRSPEQVMEGWMNSEGHRKNILQEKFTHIGVGFIKDNGTYYWTQMFIGK